MDVAVSLDYSKTSIELDWPLIVCFEGPTAHFECQKRLYGPFGRPTLVEVQPKATNLVRQKYS